MCTTHLHFLILVHQQKTGNLLQKFYPLRFGLIGYLDSGRGDGRLDGFDLGSRLGRRRIRCELVFLLVASTVGAFLAVLAQVNFAVLAADHRSVAFATLSITPFTVVTVRDVPRSYLDPLVVLQAVLGVQIELTANTLQTSAFITLKCSLLRATTGIALLTY